MHESESYSGNPAFTGVVRIGREATLGEQVDADLERIAPEVITLIAADASRPHVYFEYVEEMARRGFSSALALRAFEMLDCTVDSQMVIHLDRPRK